MDKVIGLFFVIVSFVFVPVFSCFCLPVVCLLCVFCLGGMFQYLDPLASVLVWVRISYFGNTAYINANETFGVKVKYALLSEYFDAVLSDQSVQLPTYSGDFFPYNSNNYTYWTV